MCLWLVLSGPARAQDDVHFFMQGVVEWHLQLVLGGLEPPVDPNTPLIHDAFIGQYAPGAGLRQDYLDLKGRAATTGIGFPEFELYNCGEIVMCTRTVPSGLMVLPDGEPFFAHHFAALSAAQERYNNGLHPSPEAHAAALQELLDLIETHRRLQELVIAGQVYDPFDAAELAELEDILSRRFLGDGAVLEPALSLTAFHDEQETRPVEVPMQPRNTNMNDLRRTLALIVSLDNDSPPQAIRLELRSDHIEDLQVLGLPCEGETVVVCESLWSGDTLSVQATLGPPDFSDGDFVLSSEIEAELYHRSDQPDWRQADRLRWTVPFAQCEAQLPLEYAFHVDVPATVAEIVAAIQSVPDLPGRRLYPHNEVSLSHGAPQALDQVVNDLISNRMGAERLVLYWLNRTATLEQPLASPASVLGCESGELDAALAPVVALRAEFAGVRQEFQARFTEAEAQTDHWREEVRIALADFDAGRLFVDSGDGPTYEALYWSAGTASGEALNAFVAASQGAGFADALAARANIVGALMSTIQAISAVVDLVDLKTIVEPKVEASQAWLESETYLRLMVDRLDQVDDILARHIDAVTEAHRDACICLR